MTVAIIIPPPIRKILRIQEIFCDKCPTVIPESFFAASACWFTMLPMSCLQSNCLPNVAVQITPYTRYPWIRDLIVNAGIVEQSLKWWHLLKSVIYFCISNFNATNGQACTLKYRYIFIYVRNINPLYTVGWFYTLAS